MELRSTLKRVVGFHAGVRGVKGPGAWRVAESGTTPLFVQDLIGDLDIEHAAKRMLVVQNA